MIKALRVVMIVYGVILILFGLGLIIIPDQGAELTGFGEIAEYAKWYIAILGASFITIGFWVIVAGRDPLRNIIWVKFVITLPLLFLVINVYSNIRGYVDFSQVAAHIILDVVFAILFLVFYPWRAKPVVAEEPAYKA